MNQKEEKIEMISNIKDDLELTPPYEFGAHDKNVLDWLKKTVSYDPNAGIFTSLISGKQRTKTKSGTINVTGGKKNINRCISAGRAAWLLIHGEIPNGKIVKFKNGDKTDIRLCNLELKTISERNAGVFNWDQPVALKMAKELSGTQIEYLTVIGFSHTTKKNQYDKRTNRIYPLNIHWIKCKCVCGKEVTIRYSSLGRNNKSCGCINGAVKRRKYQDPVEANARSIYRFYVKNNPGNITFEQFFKLASKPCHYCGSAPSNVSRGTSKKGFRYDNPFIYSGLDRIDSNSPHDYENCVPCCITCNYAKSDKTINEFKAWIDQLINHQRGTRCMY